MNTLTHHYQQHLRVNDVLGQVAEHYPSGPTLFELAPLDQLHIGGIKASAKLIQLLDAKTHPRVLDIGAGVGGLMRQAAELGFVLVGLDITHGFNRLNQGLSVLSGLEERAQCVTGDATHLPFATASMDAVLFQHSFLNMPDGQAVLSECRRVLRPGGKLVMHEVVSGPNALAMRYPVPWASDAAHSHLESAASLKTRLRDAGFYLNHFNDWSEDALAWRKRQRQREKETQNQRQAHLSPQLVFGERFLTMGKNLVANLADEAIKVVEIEASC
ncbi:class I SAM-dependent methyltransferase [Halomonas vilamensis]|uniref:Class I SAM-dependent methyltransferase n=1 Tax=Vreelandella vilamensis TaxID=531309 RepID=A0ABU1H6D8_9GAMM|nr:class I SAM-dependent methyltransferase [Halomonas vilamensis]MDR5899868.1 class I SAM-dependent methyltransferase [Halomonas vilamensis]